MNKPLLLMVVISLMLMAIAYGGLVAHAHMTGCYTPLYCCPDDYPDKCNNAASKIHQGEVCVNCTLIGCGVIGCYYDHWSFDYDGDGVADCVESCFRGISTGGCD